MQCLPSYKKPSKSGLPTTMSNSLTMVANYLFGWTVLTIALSWLIAGTYPLVSRVLANCKAESAAFFTLLYGMLAPTAATTALILLSMPALAFPFITDHCHGSTCAPHTLHITTNTAEGIVTVAIAVTLLMGVFTFMLIQLFSSRRQLRVLSHLSEAGATAYRVVEGPDHIAWCAGLLRPQVYLSRGLIESLTPRQVQIILAHELTHAIRKDNLRKWGIHWSTLAWPALVKAQIRQDLSNYHERICDLAAARINKDQLNKDELISTLIAYHAGTKQSVKSMDQITLQQRLASFYRVPSLKQSDQLISELKPMGIITGAWLTAAILALHIGHPLLEWLSQ